MALCRPPSRNARPRLPLKRSPPNKLNIKLPLSISTPALYPTPWVQPRTALSAATQIHTCPLWVIRLTLSTALSECHYLTAMVVMALPIICPSTATTVPTWLACRRMMHNLIITGGLRPAALRIATACSMLQTTDRMLSTPCGACGPGRRLALLLGDVYRRWKARRPDSKRKRIVLLKGVESALFVFVISFLSYMESGVRLMNLGISKSI